MYFRFIKRERSNFAYVFSNTHDINSLSVLRNANIVRAKYHRFWKQVISDFLKAIMNNLPCISFIMTSEISDILQ